MTARDATSARAVAAARHTIETVIRELTDARLAHGLSRREVASAARLSLGQVTRFERGELHDVGIELVHRIAGAVGMATSVRLSPGGDAVRDAAHLRLVDRFRARLGTSLVLQTEVPVHGGRDLRAWDGRIVGTGCRDAMEAETRLRDIGDLHRRLVRKARDDDTVEHVILVVADTSHNRAALATGRADLRNDLPLDTRAVLAALSAGRCPGASGVVVT